MDLDPAFRRRRCRFQPAALLALPLLIGCQADPDPRTGGFVDGVVNLSTGGYEAYTEERRLELESKQEEAQTLEARAAVIEAERQALDEELEKAASELKSLQDSLDELSLNLAAAEEAKSEEQARLAEAQARAQQAAKRLTALRAEADDSLDMRQRKVKELKDLIGSVALMVGELSN